MKSHSNLGEEHFTTTSAKNVKVGSEEDTIVDSEHIELAMMPDSGADEGKPERMPGLNSFG